MNNCDQRESKRNAAPIDEQWEIDFSAEQAYIHSLSLRKMQHYLATVLGKGNSVDKAKGEMEAMEYYVATISQFEQLPDNEEKLLERDQAASRQEWRDAVLTIPEIREQIIRFYHRVIASDSHTLVITSLKGIHSRNVKARMQGFSAHVDSVATMHERHDTQGCIHGIEYSEWPVLHEAILLRFVEEERDNAENSKRTLANQRLRNQFEKLRPIYECWQSNRLRLILSNLRLGVWCARKYKHSFQIPTPLPELCMAANDGLIKAVDLHDPNSAKLSTYAVHWMRQSMRHYCRLERTIGLPANRIEELRIVRGAQERLRHALCRKPTVGHIADHLQKSEESVARLLEDGRPTDTIDRPVVVHGHNTRVPVRDTLERHESSNPSDEIMQRVWEKKLQLALQGLNGLEKEVMYLRYGLTDGHNHSLEETSNITGLTREQVLDIEMKVTKRIVQH